MEKMGIQNVKEVVTLVLDAVSVVKDAQADGKIGFEDMALLMRLIPDVGPALGDVASIPSELADLSSAEAEELIAYIVSSRAGVGDSEKAKNLISGAFKIIAGAVQVVSGLKASAVSA